LGKTAAMQLFPVAADTKAVPPGMAVNAAMTASCDSA
jgi:hypothetical protein